jgi:hypothetical protein
VILPGQHEAMPKKVTLFPLIGRCGQSAEFDGHFEIGSTHFFLRGSICQPNIYNIITNRFIRNIKITQNKLLFQQSKKYFYLDELIGIFRG